MERDHSLCCLAWRLPGTLEGSDRGLQTGGHRAHRHPAPLARGFEAGRVPSPAGHECSCCCWYRISWERQSTYRAGWCLGARPLPRWGAAAGLPAPGPSWDLPLAPAPPAQTPRVLVWHVGNWWQRRTPQKCCTDCCTDPTPLILGV